MIGENPSAASDLLVAAYFDQWLAHVRTRVRIKTWEGYELSRPPGLRRAEDERVRAALELL